MVKYNTDINTVHKSSQNISQLPTGVGSQRFSIKKPSAIAIVAPVYQKNKLMKTVTFETPIYTRSKSLDLNNESDQSIDIQYDINTCKKTSIDEEGVYYYAFQL